MRPGHATRQPPAARVVRRAQARREERGLALLSALLGVALLAIVVIELTEAALVNAHLARNAGSAVAARLLARSAVAVGEAILDEQERKQSRKTSLDDDWNRPIPELPAGEGTVQFRIIDEDGKLNLNAVRDSAIKNALKQLFAELGLESELVDRVEKWMNAKPGEATSMQEARDVCQLADCQPRDGSLRSLDELRLIRGFDERGIDRLRPYVATRPDTQASVNPNTADPLVLKAIGCKVGADFPRPPGGFDKVDDIEECGEVQRRLLDLKSNTFTISAIGEVGGVRKGVAETVQSGGPSVKRMAWVELPASDLGPAEVP